MNGDAVICFTCRVRSEIGYGAVDRFFVFLRRTLPKGIGRVFRAIRPHDGNNVSSAGIKKCDARRVAP